MGNDEDLKKVDFNKVYIEVLSSIIIKSYGLLNSSKLKALISKGFDVNYSDKNNFTLLTLAKLYRNNGLVDALINFGAKDPMNVPM
jgi:ankyrin repeat protein